MRENGGPFFRELDIAVKHIKSANASPINVVKYVVVIKERFVFKSYPLLNVAAKIHFDELDGE